MEGVYKHDNTRGDTTPQLTLRCRPALLMAVIVTLGKLTDLMIAPALALRRRRRRHHNNLFKLGTNVKISPPRGRDIIRS